MLKKDTVDDIINVNYRLFGRPFPENFVPEGREQSVYRVSAEYQAFVLLLPGWVVRFKAHLMRGNPSRCK